MDRETQTGENEYHTRASTTISPVNQLSDTRISSQYQLIGDFQTDMLAADGLRQHGSDVSINSVEFCTEPVPNTCHDSPGSTALHGNSGLLSSWQLDSDVVNGDDAMDRLKTANDVVWQVTDGQQLSGEVTCPQYSNDCGATCEPQPSSYSRPPSGQNNAECDEWQFFAARRVDVPLLLDILLARKHRDRTARDFLLSLPPSVLKKYEIFSRQNPVFVCLDIVN